MQKHIILLVVVLCLLTLTLVGCNDKDNITKQNVGGTSETAETTENGAESTTQKPEESTNGAGTTNASNGDGYTKRY